MIVAHSLGLLHHSAPSSFLFFLFVIISREMIRSFKNKSQWGSLQYLTPWHLVVPILGSQHTAGHKAQSPGPCSPASSATLGLRPLP